MRFRRALARPLSSIYGLMRLVLPASTCLQPLRYCTLGLYISSQYGTVRLVATRVCLIPYLDHLYFFNSQATYPAQLEHIDIKCVTKLPLTPTQYLEYPAVEIDQR